MASASVVAGLSNRCRLLWLLALALLLGAAPTQAQDMARVRQTIATLAAPRMHGRGYVRHGDQRAAAYLRQRFRQLKLQPLAPDYTQPFPLTVNTFPGKLQLELSFGMARFPVLGNSRRLKVGEEFIAAPESGPGKIGGPLSAVPVFPLDTLVFSDATAQQRLLTQPWYGGGVAIRAADVPRLATLPLPLQQHLDSAALRFTLVPKLTASLAPAQVGQVRLEILDSVWNTYAYKQGDPAAHVALQVAAELKHNYQTQNLVAMLPGTTQPDSFVVVAAHYDHLGTMGCRAYFPGANDNASGTAMLLELAAHYARPENRPAYSVVFIAFGAEEAGLVGSRYFVQHPLVPLARIRFLLNLDLLGTGEDGLTVVNGRVLPAYFQRLQQLNEAGRFVPAIAARGKAANSDHYYFTESGVPAFFLYTRGGPTAYHDVHDQPPLPLTAFSGIFRLITGFLASL